MAQPASASVGLTFPQQPGYNPKPIGASATLAYNALVPGEQIPILGAGTYNVDLAMMPATGLVYLGVSVGLVDSLGGTVTAPVKVVFTNGYAWVPPGGFVAIAAPGLASGGVTSLSLVTTANAVVTVTAAG
jgi:hypothetical protein